MKKLLVIALSVAMVFAFAAVSMAEATFSGEIDAGYKSYSIDAPAVGQGDQSMPYIFGKIVMSGKLGDNVTGTLVIKDSDDDIAATGNANSATNNNSKMVFDEADVTFTEGFGSIKVGYFGWNNNLKDILDTLRGDVKSDCVVSASFKIAQGFTLGAAYAIPTTDAAGDTKATNSAKYGVDLGYAADAFGADLMYTTDTDLLNDSKADASRCGILGLQAYYKLGDFKPFIQYETVSGDAYSSGVKLVDAPTNTIVGFTYDSANSPVYARVEYDAAKENAELANEMGVRVGYKLASGAKIEGQYMTISNKDTKDYIKVVCPF